MKIKITYILLGDNMAKYKVCVLFLFVLCIYSFSFVTANEKNLPLLGKVVYLDPGHGGPDPGAMYAGIMEKDLNLELSKKLEKKLTELGAIVYLTRYGDYDLSVNNTINRKRSDLSRRGNIINKSECDLFLTIHLNAEETNTWKGAQVFYSENNEENKKLAELFQKELKANLNSKRNYKINNELYLQKRVTRPGILIEVGFLSNANDRYLLKQKTYQEKVATILANSTVKYFESK